jgi:hypothetical protein
MDTLSYLCVRRTKATRVSVSRSRPSPLHSPRENRLTHPDTSRSDLANALPLLAAFQKTLVYYSGAGQRTRRLGRTSQQPVGPAQGQHSWRTSQ